MQTKFARTMKSLINVVMPRIPNEVLLYLFVWKRSPFVRTAEFSSKWRVKTESGMTTMLNTFMLPFFIFHSMLWKWGFIHDKDFFGSSAKLIFLEDASSFWKFLFWQKIAALPNRYGIQTFLFAPIIFELSSVFTDLFPKMIVLNSRCWTDFWLTLERSSDRGCEKSFTASWSLSDIIK